MGQSVYLELLYVNKAPFYVLRRYHFLKLVSEVDQATPANARNEGPGNSCLNYKMQRTISSKISETIA